MREVYIKTGCGNASQCVILNHRVTLLMAVLCVAAVLTTVGQNHVSSASKLDQFVTVTLGTSFSTSFSQQQVFNGSFTVNATTGTTLPCEYWAWNFTASTGQYLSGSYNSDSPVSFFVVQQPSYQRWVDASTCGNAGDAIASQLVATSYIFTGVAIPSSGNWTIVLVNSSHANNAGGYLTAYLSTSSYIVTQPLLSTVVATTSSSSSGSSSSAISSITYSQHGVPGFPIPSIIVGIIVGLIVVFERRRNRK